jgi:hypothetical protein
MSVVEFGPKHELFHAIGDEGSAAARRLLVELDLLDRVRIRNIHYPEVLADLVARGGGSSTPALWDGVQLVEGTDAVVDALQRLATR